MIFEYIRLTGMGDQGLCFVFPLKYLESDDFQIVKSYITMLRSLRHRRLRAVTINDGQIIRIVEG